ncbi:TonB-dependent receptor domain-containing protein [Marinobacter sp.]|uniref:TonB-dependent receptor domain-containing protein n=1 Tax=Marinobacter sp. TaxID=50741 RepID=UPI003562ED89
MTIRSTPFAITLAVAGMVPGVPAAETDTPDSLEILVSKPVTGEASRLSASAMTPEPVSKLQENTAVSLSRMGGRGLDPVVHGQSQERVDVLLDGIRVEGACPNRMDPPTSRLSTSLPQTLQVVTTNRTLRWGPVTGGQVSATTAAPDFDDRLTTGHLTIGGSDNGDGTLVNASAAAGDDQAWVRLAGGHDEASDYEDGDGERVRSAYENTEGRLDGFWQADSGLMFRALVSRQEERDVKFAGAGMDAPKTDTDLYRLETGAPVANGQWRLMAWQADVDHVMDNFSLRPATMEMQTLSETRVQGVRLTLDQSPDIYTEWATGIDFESTNWDAARYGGMSLAMVNALMWPDVERERIGVFVERFHQLTPDLKAGAGVRYDRVEMEAQKADVPFAGTSAAEIYLQQYGTTATDVRDDNVSGFVDGELRLNTYNRLKATASYSVRSPGVSERYIASWSPMPGKRWIGNPGLDTEKHKKLELSLVGNADDWTWQPAIWVDQVDDFVYRTKADDGASVHRNIDARLMGADLALGWSNGRWSTSGSLSLVRGENRDDDRSLPQIPPLQYTQTLGWRYQGHTVEAQWMLARRQERVDVESGLDAGTSPGHGIVNLTGTHPLRDNLSLSWSLDNLFDKTWAAHVSRANTDPFNPDAVRVNEPGRTLRAALTASW